ncbi:Bacteriorhodopsin [Klenkia marina]|uniref:Bacteriorhodopsin n=1 Tax=Klenkia marina TaxID=1960309 RepID=A0A1G4YT99_9ACTN|nr:bacteriorhodopsin-like [Klenkia marina]SCX56670.1 Bacteriorhodopsin [Klenkia marina]
MLYDTPTPELQTLTPGQHDVVVFAVLAAAFALLAHTLHSWRSASEVGVRYRPAVVAALCIGAVATVSYALVHHAVDTGFTLVDGVYEPGEPARSSLFTRYVDWSVTVPLLTVELLAVCALAGARARRVRASTMAAAFLMVVTGFVGSQVVAEGRSTGALVGWGLVSTAFFGYLYVALVGAVRGSRGSMSAESFASLRNAAVVLLSTFGVYPLVYAVPVFVDVTPSWFVGMQVAYSAADVVAKVGFGVLVFKVAKLRTAEDLAAGAETHPEPVWVSSVHEADAVAPHEPEPRQH